MLELVFVVLQILIYKEYKIEANVLFFILQKNEKVIKNVIPLLIFLPKFEIQIF